MDRRTTAPPALDERFAVPLRGVGVDAQTRCVHYDGARDVVALRAGCCGVYHPCHLCHDETADHAGQPWPRARFAEPAVLCGACGSTMTAPAYLASGHVCPACGAAFNPGCAAHRDIYFERAPLEDAEVAPPDALRAVRPAAPLHARAPADRRQQRRPPG